jgi:tetratricopeptide (TPR) repeat protein
MNGKFACRPLTLAIGTCIFLHCLAVHASAVKVSEQNIVIPTYLAGDPEPNPMFHLGRSSQGAEGRVYPYPLYDTLTNVKSNKTYRIVYLENEYVRIGVLPEIGGRLFEAVDKSNGYNFIYRQHVIKPALIGLIGAWISGGIEWNIPHHHRATTFLPVQYRVENGADGSKTIWVGELEVRQRMRWVVGYTLHPGKSYLECSVRILNRTPVVNTMLCFANVAVHVNDQYQVIYPPSTRFVTFHGKREFTTWPIATTKYAGADFTRGVDVSWYSNHISANSMFAWNYQDDFFAGYDHGRNAGIMSFADHHMIPGKKFWTWGNGPRGRMWDKILTDDDGPYIELMVGAYSDNQPDYSWLQPFETKSFEMYWYPFRNIGGVKMANLDAAVNLEIATNGTAKVGFCTTALHRGAIATLKAGPQVLFSETLTIDPGRPFEKEVSIPAATDEHLLRATLSEAGRDLVAYSPIRLDEATMPKPVTGPPPPSDVKTSEELYLDGQRLEQFHSPNGDPETYWQEALKRDPYDARVNTALGIREFKEYRFAESEQYFRKALERLTANYTAPKNGEAFYYLGLALKAQDKLQEAFDTFFKATWSEAWRSPAYVSLAEIATRKGELSPALDYVNRALQANALNVRASTLKAALLRHTGQAKAALAVLDSASYQTDPLDVRLMTERWRAGDTSVLHELTPTLWQHPATALETVAEYADAGLWADGTNFLGLVVRTANNPSRVSPLVYYYLADFATHLSDPADATTFRLKAAQMSPDYVFPFQWEVIAPLKQAIEFNPEDARAPYYLGNLLFDGQPEEAVKLWKKSAALDPKFAIVHRNLAVAYSHQKPNRDVPSAIRELELAVAAPVRYAEHFTELDELYAEAEASPTKRLALLEENHAIVTRRDDALSREIGLKVFAGKYDEAIRLMTGRKFSVWEGGSLEVVDHWVNAHILRGRQELDAGKAAAALADFKAAREIPENLPTEQEIGRLAELFYWLGLAFEATGDKTKARDCWNQAANNTPAGRRRGSTDRVSERQVQRCYAALAQRKLGKTTEAEAELRKLVETKNASQDRLESHESSGRSQQSALANYVYGLAYLGLGEANLARDQFNLALSSSPDFLPAKAELAYLQ